MLRKASKVGKFKGAEGRWKKMKPNWLNILSDDASDPALLRAAEALISTPLRARLSAGDDLGETMVVLHAYVQALNGADVFVIIDDAKGKAFARVAITDIQARKVSGEPVGRIQLVGTIALIERRLNSPDIPDLVRLGEIWAEIAPLDDGLPRDLAETGLHTSARWANPSQR